MTDAEKNLAKIIGEVDTVDIYSIYDYLSKKNKFDLLTPGEIQRL